MLMLMLITVNVNVNVNHGGPDPNHTCGGHETEMDMGKSGLSMKALYYIDIE
jgi:hypothetical protein